MQTTPHRSPFRDLSNPVRPKSRALVTLTLEELTGLVNDRRVHTPHGDAAAAATLNLAATLPVWRCGHFRIRGLLDGLNRAIAKEARADVQSCLCSITERVLMATGNYKGFGHALPNGEMLPIPVEPDPGHAGGYRITGGQPVQNLPGYSEYCRHYYIAPKLWSKELKTALRTPTTAEESSANT